VRKAGSEDSLKTLLHIPLNLAYFIGKPPERLREGFAKLLLSKKISKTVKKIKSNTY
jgi:hypothetical protein